MKSYCLCCCFFLIRTYYFTQADDKLAIPSALQQELSNRPQSMKHPIGKQIAGGRPVSSYQTVVLERDGYVKNLLLDYLPVSRCIVNDNSDFPHIFKF